MSLKDGTVDAPGIRNLLNPITAAQILICNGCVKPLEEGQLMTCKNCSIKLSPFTSKIEIVLTDARGNKQVSPRAEPFDIEKLTPHQQQAVLHGYQTMQKSMVQGEITKMQLEVLKAAFASLQTGSRDERMMMRGMGLLRSRIKLESDQVDFCLDQFREFGIPESALKALYTRAHHEMKAMLASQPEEVLGITEPPLLDPPAPTQEPAP